MSATTSAEIVLDASVAVRGLLERGEAAELVGRIADKKTSAHAPDLIVSEVTNALRVSIHPERWPIALARERLETFLEWPVALHPCRPLAGLVLETATALGISAYDAFYAVLSAELGLSLITADRRLAAAVPGAVHVA